MSTKDTIYPGDRIFIVLEIVVISIVHSRFESAHHRIHKGWDSRISRIHVRDYYFAGSRLSTYAVSDLNIEWTKMNLYNMR